jgi:hypothetical protein
MNYPRNISSLAGRMALVALVIGTSVTASATERVTIPLVLAGAIGWSFVPILQLMTGLLLVRGARSGQVRLLNRYFATGWPWLLWILAAHAAFIAVPATRNIGLWFAATAAAPILWTIYLLDRFCRQELGLDARLTRWRIGVHQAATYVLVAAYVWVAVALWPRIIRLFG